VTAIETDERWEKGEDDSWQCIESDAATTANIVAFPGR
jgi:hypothetical protein